MLHNLHFSPSKCRLFHNATLFGFCITHILNTGCAKIWKKIRRQKVNKESWEIIVWNLECKLNTKHSYAFGIRLIFHGATSASGLALHHYRCFKITIRHTVGSLWAGDQSVADASIWQHTTSQDTDIHGRGGFRFPLSQQASGRSPTS